MHFAFIFLVAIDQITKVIFADRDFSFLGLSIHPVKNYALPFGVDFGGPWNFLILLAVYAVVGRMIAKMESSGKWTYFAKSIFLAGAASNLADRLIYGYVRDFIDLNFDLVFNLADVFIVVGLALLFFLPNRKQLSTGQTYQK